MQVGMGCHGSNYIKLYLQLFLHKRGKIRGYAKKINNFHFFEAFKCMLIFNGSFGERGGGGESEKSNSNRFLGWPRHSTYNVNTMISNINLWPLDIR